MACESCDRLREANRRLQAEGPALERDKLIIELRAALVAQRQLAGEAAALLESIGDDEDEYGVPLPMFEQAKDLAARLREWAR